MFYRLLGKLFFWFVIMPFFGQIFRTIFVWMVKVTAKHKNDPNWTASKELSELIANRAMDFLYKEADIPQPRRSSRPYARPSTIPNN